MIIGSLLCVKNVRQPVVSLASVKSFLFVAQCPVFHGENYTTIYLYNQELGRQLQYPSSDHYVTTGEIH